MQSSQRPPLVLIVDDNDDSREMYAEFLRLSGFATESASNGLKAIEASQRLRPEAVLLDLSLPGLDGWEVIRRMRQDDRTRQIKIVVLTGRTGEAPPDLDRAYDAFLLKPCLPDDLLSELRRLLNHRPEGTR